MRSIVIAILVCFSGIAIASDNLTITSSGYYLTHIDADGVPSYYRIETVIDLRGDSSPTPDEPDQPQVDVVLVSKVKAWAADVGDPQSAQAISAVYAHVRGALSDGTLTPANVFGPLKQATDSALGVITEVKDWSVFRGKVTEQFTEAQQRGRLSDAKQIAVVLLSVQQGVELAADGSTALTMDQMVEIARRTNLAIDGAAK